MERYNGDYDDMTKRYGSAAGDLAMKKWWSPDAKVNGQRDPLSFGALLGYRELRRGGNGVRLSMHGKRPVIWTGIMNWLDHAVSGQTTAEATGTGVAEPTADQQRDWKDTNDYALATLDTISACISNFGVINTIIMRERRESRMVRRTGNEEHALRQETYFILQQFAGGAYEVEQALRRMTEYCQHRLMTTSAILDLCFDADTVRTLEPLLRARRLCLESAR